MADIQSLLRSALDDEYGGRTGAPDLAPFGNRLAPGTPLPTPKPGNRAPDLSIFGEAVGNASKPTIDGDKQPQRRAVALAPAPMPMPQPKPDTRGVLGDIGRLTPAQAIDTVKGQKRAAEKQFDKATSRGEKLRAIRNLDLGINPEINAVADLQRKEAQAAPIAVSNAPEAAAVRAGQKVLHANDQLAGNAPMPDQTPLRNAVDVGVRTFLGTGPDLVKAAGIVGGAVPGIPEENAVTRLADAAEVKVREAFPGDNTQAETFVSTLAQGGGSMAGFLIGNIAAKSTAKLLGASGEMAGTIGAAGTGAGVQAVQGYEEAKDSGSGALARYTAFLLNAGIGTTEALPIDRFFARLNKVSGGRVNKILSDTTAQSLEEFTQEVVQSVASDTVARAIYDPDREIGSDALMNGIIGGILGAGMGAASGAISRPEARQDIPASNEQVAPQDQPPAAAAGDGMVAPEASPPLVEPIPSLAPQAGEPGGKVDQPDIGPAPAVAADVTPQERSILNQMGYPDELIGEMARPEIDGELAAAEEMAIKPQGDNQRDQVDEFDAAAAQKQTGDGTRAAPVKVEQSADIEAAASNVNREPTDSQKEAGNYQKGHISINGLDVTIENPKGSTRSGQDANGNKWSVEMPSHYGYVKRTTGADGDQVDVYIGDSPQSSKVFVVDQIDPESGLFDEHKAILGAASREDALDLYHRAFNDGRGPERAGAVTEMPTFGFKAWLNSGDTKKPLSYQEPKIKAVGRKREQAVYPNVDGFPGTKSGKIRRPPSLLEFLAASGGLARDAGGELAAMDLIGRHGMTQSGPVARANGMKLDHAREVAEEAGYITSKEAGSTTTINDLIDAIREERGGQRIYAREDQQWAEAYDIQQDSESWADREEAEANSGNESAQLRPDRVPVEKSADPAISEREALQELDDLIEELGLDIDKATHLDVFELMIVEDLPADVAMETYAIWHGNELVRAVSEPTDAALEWIQPAQREGWDDETDPATASGAGAGIRPDGGQPSERGQGNRSETSGEVAPAVGEAGGRTAAEVGQGGDGRGDRARAGEGQQEENLKPNSVSPKPNSVSADVDQEPETEAGADNKPQTVIPGAEKATDANMAQRGANAALKPKREQKAADIGLFGDDSKQADLVDQARARSAGGDEVNSAGADVKKVLRSKEWKQVFGSTTNVNAKTEHYAHPESPVAGDMVRGWLDARVDKAPRKPKSVDEAKKGGYNPRDSYLEGYVGGREGRAIVIPNTEALAEWERLIGVEDRTEPEQAEGSPVAAFRDRLIDPDGGFKNIATARKFAAENGLTSNGATPEAKQIEETIEYALVLASREIVKAASDPARAYDDLVALYKRQPNLGTRTSKSMAEMAYSTPMPLSYLASRLAGVTQARSVLEPSAGNGALLMETNPKKQTVFANEIDDTRAAHLDAQGYLVSRDDATEINPDPVDVVIANPPFGAIREGGRSKTFNVDGWKTSQIDHAIALKALHAMDANGRAVLLVGSVKDTEDATRSDSYNSKQKREFYARLYRTYNVVDHFTVDGKLYSRQGAGWPVDVIVIDGKGKSARSLPAADVPAMYRSWEDLAEKLTDVTLRSTTSNPRQDGQSTAEPFVDRPEPQADGGAPRGENVASRVVERGSDIGQTAARRGESDRGKPAGIRDERGDAAGARREPEIDRDGGRADQPAAAEQPRLLKDAAPAARAKVDEAPNQAGQSAYNPSSRRGQSLGTLVPANLRTAISKSLDAVQLKHGDIDQFVANELDYDVDQLVGYFSAEQIDALALGIDNIQNGDGMIVGDQTGIGKGRVVAGLLRYAHSKGMLPVFVTEKPDLYGDMWRDIHDIGWPQSLPSPINIFMTNATTSVPLDDEAVGWVAERDTAKANGDPAPKRRGEFMKSQTAAAVRKRMAAISAGAEMPDIVFTTYDQMNSVKGQETDRRRFIDRIAPKAFIIMDEAHNAGGQGGESRAPKDKAPPRAAKFREWVQAARAVVYSSATYAKNPNVMDLFSRTDMAKAVDNAKDLPELIARGGVPLQQVVSSMLTSAGQYVRRERSFEGVSYEVETAPVDAKTYSDFTTALRSIFQFDLLIKDEREAVIEDWLKEQGAGLGKDSGVGEAAADSTAFASIMHNVINQMVLSIKANAAADQAIAALKRGEKPVLGLSFTMESFVKDYASEAELQHGQDIDIDFSDVLRRYLERTRRLTIKDSDNVKSHMTIPVEKFSTMIQAEYKAAEALIADMDYSGLPVSPIDWIRHRITEAGYSVREITGRSDIIDYSSGTPVYSQREKREQGSGGKRVTIDAFNKGQLDAVILNKSGSTGVSLHASEKFKDTRKRTMIIVQADPNIDTHMQMLGRVHRTGQVQPPSYVQLAADIPAEARPTAVLLKKMASLNANTTASRKSVFSGEAVDFMNDYGDLAAYQILNDDPELNYKMGYPLKVDQDGDTHSIDAMRRVTGRLVLLPPAEQQALLDQMTSAYQAIITRMDALGENALEAKAIDLQAKPVDTFILKDATGPSPFQSSVLMEKVSAKAQGRAMAPKEVIAAIADGMKVAKPERPFSNALQELNAQSRPFISQTIERQKQISEIFIKGEIDALKKVEAKDKKRRQLEENLERWKRLYAQLQPGMRINILRDETSMPAVVLRVEQAGKAKNPVALSSWSAVIAVPDSAREIHMPFSQVFFKGDAKSEDEKGIVVGTPLWTDTAEQLETLFEEARKEGRENRYIVTGNILAGYDTLTGRGQIVQFTNEGGGVRPGILMPRGFSYEKWSSTRAVRFQSAKQVIGFIDKVPDGEIKSKDGLITIRRAAGWRASYEIDMPAARGTGGVYFTDSDVRKIYDNWTKRGSRMRAEVDKGMLEKLVGAFIKLEAVFETRESQDIAQEVIKANSVKPVYSMTPRARDAAGDIKTAIEEIVSRITAGEVDVEFHDEIIATDGEAAIASGGKEGMSAGGYMMPGEALIGIALEDPLYDPLTTAGHEAWHHVELSGMLNEAETQLLQRELPRLRGLIEPEVASPEIAKDLPAHEVNAIAFAKYRREMEEDRSPRGMHIGVRRIFEKIQRMFARIRNYLAGNGFQTFEDLFERTRTGDTASRATGMGKAAGEVVYSQNYNMQQRGRGKSVEQRPFTPPSDARYRHEFWMNRVGGILGSMPTLDMVRRKVQDRFLIMQRYQETLQKQFSIARMPEQFDVYLAESLYYGRSGERIAELREKVIDPLTDEMRAKGISHEQLGLFLYAKHAPERNATIAERNPDKPDGGSGMTNAEALETLDDFRGAGLLDGLEALASKVYAMNRQALDRRYRAGLLSREQYDQIRSQWQFYVPLRGFEGLEDVDGRPDGPRNGSGFQVRGKEYKSALGRGSRADSPLAYSIMNSMEAIVRAEKNRVGKTFLRLAQALPNKSVWEIKKAEIRQRLNPETGVVEQYVVPMAFVNDKEVFTVKVGGKAMHVVLKDPRLARALKNMGVESTGPLVRVFGKFARIYSSLQTAWNPEFVLRNFTKDMETAIGFLGEHDVKGIRRRVVKNTFPAMKGMYRNLHGKTDDRWTELARRYREAGGKISFFEYENIETLKTGIEKQLSESDVRRRIRTAFENLIDIPNGAVENGVRLATFEAMLNSGATPAKAASAARELTVNFNRKGEWGSLINSFYVFFNASVQGNTRLVQLAAKSKSVRRAILATAIVGFINDMINAALSDDDDDTGMSEYDMIPGWERDRNIIVPGTANSVKIPLAYGFNIPYVFGQEMSRMFRGVSSPAESASASLGAMVDTFSPIGAGPSLLQVISPTILDPAVQVAENKSWFGAPIMPELFGPNDTRPDSQLKFDSVAPWAQSAAEALNSATGGSKYEPGAIDVSPESIELMGEFVTGGIGRTISKAAKTGEALIYGTDLATNDIPFVRVFVREQSDFIKRGMFYDSRSEVQSAHNAIRAMDKDNRPLAETRAFRKSHKAELEAYDAFKAANKQLKGTRAERRQVEQNTRLGVAARKQKIDAIRAREIKIMMQAQRSFDRARKRADQ